MTQPTGLGRGLGVSQNRIPQLFTLRQNAVVYAGSSLYIRVPRHGVESFRKNHGKIHHFIAGQMNYFDWAMASIAFCMFTRGYPVPCGYESKLKTWKNTQKNMSIFSSNHPRLLGYPILTPSHVIIFYPENANGSFSTSVKTGDIVDHRTSCHSKMSPKWLSGCHESRLSGYRCFGVV